MTSPITPPNVSVALKVDDTNKLFAPSAERNAPNIAAIIKSAIGSKGQALEIASGTGQHIIVFASAMPDIHWQPSEIEPARLKSIAAYISESGLTNIEAPIILDAAQSGWSNALAPKDLITVTNLLHLIGKKDAMILIQEAEKALKASGKLIIYGPFKRAGKFISEGDKAFDASIQAANHQTGYKDDAWVKKIARQNNLSLDQAIEMPANNLILIFQKA